MVPRTFQTVRPLAALFFLLACSLLSGCGFLGSGAAQHPPLPGGANKVVKTAYAQMGKKYRSGGASPQKGFDCSGLVWWAYKQNGVKVPRITVDQAKTGRPVAKTQARAGDIVVFRTPDSPRGLHTGLYAGNDSFIHSPSRGGRVRMDSMELPYWKRSLLSVRRVVKN